MVRLDPSLRFNYEDYCRLPNNGRRYEIIDGDLHNHPAPVIKHQDIVGRLFVILSQYVTRNNLGRVFISPTDVIFSNEDIVQPDIIFISKKREKIITEKNIQDSPDLIIEVISEGTEDYDRITKRRLYGKFKVKEYWVINIYKEEVELFEFKKGGYKKFLFKKKDSLKSKIIKGLIIPVSDIL